MSMKLKKLIAITIIIICLILMGFNIKVYGLSDGDYAFYSEGSIFYYTKLLSSTINPIIAVIPNGNNMICVKMQYDAYSGYFYLPSGYEQYYNAPYNISKQLIASDLNKKWSKDSGSNYYYINTAMGSSNIATYRSGEVPNQYNYSTQSSNTSTGTSSSSSSGTSIAPYASQEAYNAAQSQNNGTAIWNNMQNNNGGVYNPGAQFVPKDQQAAQTTAHYTGQTVEELEEKMKSTINSKVYDTSDSSGSGTSFTSGINPDNYGVTPDIEEGEVTNLVGKILGFINVLGVIIFILSIMILGIKYMVGSVEQKADYKHTMIPILIGAFLIFGITSILNLVYSLVSQFE